VRNLVVSDREIKHYKGFRTVKFEAILKSTSGNIKKSIIEIRTNICDEKILNALGEVEATRLENQSWKLVEVRRMSG